MLVLRRRPGEALILNDAIKIYVLAVEGDRVKLGIDAPPDVIVVRGELLPEPIGFTTEPRPYFPPRPLFPPTPDNGDT